MNGPSPARAADSALPGLRTLIFVLALGLFWVARLDALPLFDIDEGAFAEASREMLVSGDWGHTTLNGADRFDKPILVYWLQAASLAVFGRNEIGARLPSALCGWAWCLALAAFAAPRWGRGAAMAAALLLASAVGPALIGRAATADALLNLLLTLAGLDLWRHLESGARAPLRRAALWIGLGLLTKGPIALLIPGAALLLWVLFSGEYGRLRRALSDASAWLILVAVATPWYAYALWRHGQAFVDGFIVRHNLDRFSGPLEGHGGSPVYYIVVLPLLLLPWAPLLLPLAARARRWWADDPLSRFLLIWAGFVLVFFSLSGTKLPHYALYGATPLVLLTARLLPGLGTGAVLAVAAAAVAMVALGPASAALAVWLAERVGDPAWIALLQPDALPAAPAVLPAAVIAAAIAALALWRRAEAPVRVLVIALLGTGYTVSQTVPWWGQALSSPVRELALQARQLGGEVVQWRLHQPSLGFYADRPALRRAPEAGEMALVRRDRLTPSELAALEVLGERRSYLLVRRP